MRSINIDDKDVVITSIVSKQGNSFYLNIPYKVVRKFGIEVGDIVTLIIRNKIKETEF